MKLSIDKFPSPLVILWFYELSKNCQKSQKSFVKPPTTLAWFCLNNLPKSAEPVHTIIPKHRILLPPILSIICRDSPANRYVSRKSQIRPSEMTKRGTFQHPCWDHHHHPHNRPPVVSVCRHLIGWNSCALSCLYLTKHGCRHTVVVVVAFGVVFRNCCCCGWCFDVPSNPSDILHVADRWWCRCAPLCFSCGLCVVVVCI